MSPSSSSSVTRAGVIALCAALVLVAGARADAPDAQALHVDVSFSTPELRDADSELLVEWAVTNPTKKVLGMLWWHTPLKGVRGDLFKISHLGEKHVPAAGDDVPVTYKGIHAMRLKGPYSLDNFIRIQPGETRSVTVDVTKFYDFHVAGNYSVSLKDEAAYYMAKEVKDAVMHATTETDLSAPTVVQVNHGATIKAFPAKVHQSALTARPVLPNFQNVTLSMAEGASRTGVHCTSYQNTVWQASVGYAMTEDECGYHCIKTGDCAMANKYLGGTNSGESDIYARSYNLFNSGVTHYDCNPDSCGSGSTYAYVYPTDTTDHTIHLCDVYWRSSTYNELWSTDSKPGTLIHESTHFNDIGATRDHVYGQSSCASLARTQPSTAQNTADCYEYTVENHPSC